MSANSSTMRSDQAAKMNSRNPAERAARSSKARRGIITARTSVSAMPSAR